MSWLQQHMDKVGEHFPASRGVAGESIASNIHFLSLAQLVAPALSCGGSSPFLPTAGRFQTQIRRIPPRALAGPVSGRSRKNRAKSSSNTFHFDWQGIGSVSSVLSMASSKTGSMLGRGADAAVYAGVS